MAKYRKKPIEVEAMQFTGHNCYDILRFTNRGDLLLAGLNELKQTDHPIIETLEGNMEAKPGDWIIRGVKGEFYPCKPDIFNATYEAA